MFMLLKILLSLIVFVIIVAIAVLGYLGFVPGVSGLFGTDKPRDLGVVATVEDLATANSKTGVRLETLPLGTRGAESIRYSGSHEVTQSFSGFDLTALINNGKWIYQPVSQVQVRISDEGVVEATGLLRLDRLQTYAQATGIPADDLKKALDTIKYVTSNPPFYVKGSASVANNKVSVDIALVEVGRLPLPAGVISEHRTVITNFLEDRIRRVPGLMIRTAKFESGNLIFDGTLPDVESTAQE